MCNVPEEFFQVVAEDPKRPRPIRIHAGRLTGFMSVAEAARLQEMLNTAIARVISESPRNKLVKCIACSGTGETLSANVCSVCAGNGKVRRGP